MRLRSALVCLLACANVTAALASSVPPLELARDLSEGSRELIAPWGLITLAGASVGFSLARTQDLKMQEHFERRRRLGEIEPFTNEILGTGIPGAALGLAFWGAGSYVPNAYAARAGIAQLEALAVTGLFTLGLKTAVKRDRPEGGDHATSFPSGHTSTVFASATVLAEFYGAWVGVPAYALGVATAVGRMADRKHWFSDTVAGAALGVWVGRAFSKVHLNRHAGGKTLGMRLRLLPVFDGESSSLMARWEF